MDKLLLSLYEYGPIGFFCAALILAIRIIWNALKDRWNAQEVQHNENKERISNLESKYENYLMKDHATMLEALQANTTALEAITKIVAKTNIAD